MEILIILFIVGCASFILLASRYDEKVSASRMKLSEEATGGKFNFNSFLNDIFPFTHKMLEKIKIYDKIKLKLDASRVKFSVQAFFNLKILLIVVLCIAAYFGFNKFDPPTFIVCLALGYIIPDIFLKQIIARRKNAIARILPETVDLLGLCIEAGLDFTTSIKWILEKTTMNPMLEELGFVLEEIKWGKSRSQALKDMSRRLNISEVSSFVQTLVLAERMGTPVAEAFTILSEDSRMQRFNRGERIAMQAPLKILIPLIFCILPVIGIVIGGPILLDFVTKKVL
ncbi:MAG: type II secretion system F family protein [Candidatus Omnitrophica bacterium]|jgi:tight adherence protein C|nr:type II secretion system F family protein [Candidatus Omnitrophota bacterium]